MRVQYSRIPAKLYRLRWRFTYSDHKPDVYGVWDERSSHVENKASYKSKVNLSRAIIEGEFVGAGNHTIKFIDIPGHSMRHVRIGAFAPLSMGQLLGDKPGKIKLTPRMSSIFFQTDDNVIGVNVNGQTFTRPIENADKFQSFEHSAGV